MIVVMRKGSSQKEIEAVAQHIRDAGLRASVSKGEERAVIGILGSPYPELKDALEALPGVDQVLVVSRPFKLASREFHPDDTVVKVGGVTIGGGDVVVMAGPCSVENREQLLSTARAVKAAGATILRGGAFKPRTSPYKFRGLGEEGLKLLAEAREETGLPVVTEVMSERDVELVARYADILQLGARNMQNFVLLDELGKASKPILLKRGLSATIEEWLLAADYILQHGKSQVILCERGIRTYETYTRNTFDLSAIPLVHKLSHLPVIADPSHGTGKWYLVQSMALAAAAAGADGLMIEVHPSPDHALSDGSQSLTFENFKLLMEKVGPVAAAVGRKMARAPVAAPARRRAR
ncbi:MAG: 3-deoxy-7-phosphoheptulonate synthase [Dehalococcoidia bacterium]|nr:3-deoxy-7-phosphoheptulonate synthase [Dehalococcoidia bacterium]